MYRLLIFSIAITLLFSFSCNETKPTKTTESAKTTTPTATVPTKIAVQGKAMYPSVPVEIIKSLFEKCDYVDYSFENLPLSINRQEPRDIQHSLAQIAAEPALINEACPPLGRMLYYQNGEIALEGIIYFSEGCNYFVFLENNKPKYANFMTASGINFFKDLLSKLGGMKK